MTEIVTNRKARRDYNILETFEAGLVLRGTEVKALRAGRGQIADAFVQVRNGEASLENAHIEEYAQGNRFNHAPRAPRKLLLHKSEIRKLAAAVEVKGNALVALSLYWKNGRVKASIGIGQGKQQYDKRETLKRREADRELRRVVLHTLKSKAKR